MVRTDRAGCLKCVFPHRAALGSGFPDAEVNSSSIIFSSLRERSATVLGCVYDFSPGLAFYASPSCGRRDARDGTTVE